MSVLPYPVYDADNHLYEPEEAFLRHLPKKYHKDFLFVDVKGRKKLVIGGMLSEYIPNPTFEVVAGPGTHEKWYRADNPEGLTLREMTGEVVRPPREWRTGDGRLAVMDQQGIHAALVFPTLASVIEERLGHRHDLVAALFHSLNQWTQEEWGFARDNRLFSVPMIGLGDVDLAVKELDFVLKSGARAVGIRPAPVPNVHGSKSFGLPEFDPFWARCAEAKIFVCFHASDSGYDRVYRDWAGGGTEFVPFEKDPFKQTLELLERPIADSMSAMVCHGALERHPDLRVVSVENGSEWVHGLLIRLDRAYGQMPDAFKRHPRETFERQIFVAPFYENDPIELAKDLPVERILFGSDFPHPEGLAEPLDYIKEFSSFDDSQLKRIFHTNLKGLLEGVRD
ncbi:MAG: amidohydrolase [Porticoccaceae bacterium]|nr:amidohydrolase [Porticoccaceae bacterium]